MRITRLSELWINEIVAEDRITPQTVNQYESSLRTSILPALGNLRIREATVGRLDRFLKTVAENRPAAAKSAKCVLGQMLSLAVRHGALPTNPVRDTGRLRKPRRTITALTAENLEAVRAAIRQWQTPLPGKPGPRHTSDLADVVDLMLATGGRIGEILALRWEDLDLSAARPTLTFSGTIVFIKGRGSYRTGPIGGVSVMLNSVSPDDFVSRALSVRELTHTEDRLLREYNQVQSTAAQQQAALQREVEAAQAQTDELGRRSAQIQNALAVAAGGPTNGIPIPASADPAPRNPDGSFPDERCSVKDPTTSGCLTPRTLHALQQARLAGFTRYTACWRQESWGEHPLGRACDFAAAKNGFAGVATGGDKDYGNRLAGWLIGNADRLGVLYIIWFRQIWEPSRGWHAYSRGDGTPGGDHTNHVHLSIR